MKPLWLWFVIPSVPVVVFFLAMYCFAQLGNNFNINFGQNYGNSITTTGYATLVGKDVSLIDNTENAAKARQAAFDDAKAKAIQLSNLAGKQIGTITSISEYVEPNPTDMGDYKAALAAPDASVSSTLRMSVTATFNWK